MITCPKCHHESADDAKFCGNCAMPLSTAHAQEDPFVGKCIDNKYYVQKRIASGGMGVVYLAKQKGVGQEVAIKKLHPEHYRDQKIVQRFINEARSYAQISHPNAVKLHDLLNINGQICIVMEFVHGKTLTDYIEHGFEFSIRQIVDISLQLADALATVHREGIIHRDLKTENVMLLETIPGRFSVKILDFGIAKILDSPNKRETQNGVIVGTPEFMSPEQCYGQTVDYRTDIYAFGILMYVMICGKLPFESESAIGMLHKQIHEPMPQCRRPNGTKISDNLEAIVEKCTAKDREERYQKFADVITDLMCVQEGKPLVIAHLASKKSPSAESEQSADKSDKDSDKVQAERSEQNESKPDSEEKEGLSKQTPDKESSSKDSFAIDLDIDESAEPISSSEESKVDSAQPKQSFVFRLDESIEPETKHGRTTKTFSLDQGQTELSDFSMEDSSKDLEFSDNGEFSLGDIDELDIEPEDESYSESKSPIALIMTVVVILAVGAAVYMYFSEKRADDSAQTSASIPTALESTLSAETINQIAAKAPAERADTVQAPTESTAPAPPIVETKQEIEAPPSQVTARLILERGVLRAAMTKSEQLLNNGELKEAEKLTVFFQDKKEYLVGEDASKYEALESLKTLFSDTMKQAEKAKRDGKCEKIQTLLDPLPEQAVGMREAIDKLAVKCSQIQAAPPTTL